MKKFYFLFAFITAVFGSRAQVLSPSDFLGYELGTKFTRHHQVIAYVNHLASQSSYAQTLSYGHTYENRVLQLVYLTSPKNLAQLESIRKDHLRKIDFEKGELETDNEVGIVWLSYNVHGNESTSTEAALKTLFTLVTEKKEWLQNLVVIIDPCINPDGRDRYVNWYNQVKSTPFDQNPIANEHFEDWPGGRYNHYYHDLNRDWAWLSQVESQQRLPYYQSWMPHIHVDFHEQGVNSPYYFAPAAEPYHDMITDFQRDFQIVIGKNHAKYFDQKGWRYFSKEVFDLLYPGYGDTYPMFNGAIGMTYEQGGSGRAGLSILNELGKPLTLKDRIAHHYTTSLSTVEIAHQNVAQLNSAFKDYHENPRGKYNAYIMEGHPDKIKSLKNLLDAHQISTKSINQKTNLKGIDFEKQTSTSKVINTNALIVEGKGKKGNLVQALFEPKTNYADSLTYDITAWSLPYAYGLNAMASNQKIETKPFVGIQPKITLNNNAYAYAAERKSFQDGKFLAALIKNNIRVFYNQVPLTNGGKRWDEGSVFILRGENEHIPNLTQLLKSIADSTEQDIVSLSSGFSDKGPDLGSNQMRYIKNKKVGILKSDNASPINYGEIWHFFEQQLSYPLTQLSDERLNEYFLKNLDVLIIPNGYFTSLFDVEGKNALSHWLKKGGRIIAIGNALKSFSNHELFSLKTKTKTNDTQEKQLPYAEQERENIRSVIFGSIYKAKVDGTHPLATGYNNNYFTLKTNASAYELLSDSGSVAHLPAQAKPIAGHSGDKATKTQGNSLIFGMENVGRGSVVYMVDNPLYRNFWENGKLWLINAVFN